MLRKNYLQKSSKLFEDRALLKFAVIGLAIVAAFNWSSNQDARNSQRVLMVPLVAGNDLWITGGDASQTYLRGMSRYLTQLLGTYTAATARSQFEELARLVHPESMEAMRVQLSKAADTIERFPSITSVFYLTGREPIIREGDQLFIQGLKKRITSGQETQSNKITYVVDFRIQDGRFWILSIDEVPTDQLGARNG